MLAQYMQPEFHASSPMRASQLALGLMTVLLPPAAVAMKTSGRTLRKKVIKAILLTLCLWVPGKI